MKIQIKVSVIDDDDNLMGEEVRIVPLLDPDGKLWNMRWFGLAVVSLLNEIRGAYVIKTGEQVFWWER